MNKIIRVIAAAALMYAPTMALAQNARETSVKFMKENQNAVVADYDLPKDLVGDALKERLEKAGLGKKSTEKGFMVYKGVSWNEIGPEKMDVYARVDGKGDKSSITILVSKGYNNFITSATDADKVQKVQAFLNNFLKDARAYQLRLSVAAQEEVVRKAEKEVKSTADDADKLNRERERIERQLAENKSEQAKKQAAADAEKKKLEELKAQAL